MSGDCILKVCGPGSCMKWPGAATAALEEEAGGDQQSDLLSHCAVHDGLLETQNHRLWKLCESPESGSGKHTCYLHLSMLLWQAW